MPLPIAAPTMTLVGVRLSTVDGETEVVVSASMLTIVMVVGFPEIVVVIVPMVRVIETGSLSVSLDNSVPVVIKEPGAPVCATLAEEVVVPGGSEIGSGSSNLRLSSKMSNYNMDASTDILVELTYIVPSQMLSRIQVASSSLVCALFSARRSDCRR